MNSIIAEESEVFRSPAEKVYCYTPSILALPSGRLAASFDLSGLDLRKSCPPPYTDIGDCAAGNQLVIMISDDGGKNWRITGRLAMLHATLFRNGKDLYVIGHAGSLWISRSRDDGESWCSPALLDDHCKWHQSACHLEHWAGKIYLAFEQRLPSPDGVFRWPNVTPIVMSCRECDDLLDRKNWIFGKSMPTEDILSTVNPNCGDPHSFPFILESNLIRLRQEDHEFYRQNDPNLFLIMRTTYDFGSTGAVLRVTEGADGSLGLDFVKRKNTSRFFFFPMPGGNMKFYLDYDEESALYWMAASQSCDFFLKSSFDRLDGGPRQRLGLYFSKDAFSWCFAGLVAKAPGRLGSRHYASFAMAGKDLYVLSRSGTPEAESQHNGNRITLHVVRNFRDLAY